ncbi:MAG: O-antigen ligase family protein [Acidobacteria bacterium]|nr:O-antigen ligase family protein [Acidobacteriota bacterium]
MTPRSHALRRAASDDITSNRSQIWSVTVKVIGEYMPLGAGLGAFTQAYAKLDTSSGFERVDQAHNDYLQVLADAGIVGLVIGALFLFWFFRESRRNVRIDNKFRRGIAVGAFAGCFGILVHSAFDFVLHITAVSVMFLAVLSILVATGRKYHDDITDHDDESSRRRRRKASVVPITEKAS